MSNPKISVVIPVRNGEKTLRRCLESVLDQTYPDFEVVVVDNGSEDRTKDIIMELGAKNGKIRYFFEPVISRGAARNVGVEQSLGKIIAMIDADCVAPRDWIKGITAPISAGATRAVQGGEEDLVKNYWTENFQKKNSDFIGKNLKDAYLSHLDTKNFAIEASLIREFKFDDKIRIGEDFDLYLRLKRVSKILFSPNVRVGHHHQSSFIGFCKQSFGRGYWAYRIYKKHRMDDGIEEEPMLESVSLMNNVDFLLGLVPQFFKSSLGDTFFILVSELTWRFGLFFGWLSA